MQGAMKEDPPALTSRLLALPQRKYRPNRRGSALAENQLEIEKNKPQTALVPTSPLLTLASARDSRFKSFPGCLASPDRLKPPPGSMTTGKIKLSSSSNHGLKPALDSASSHLGSVLNSAPSRVKRPAPAGDEETNKTLANSDVQEQGIEPSSNSSASSERLRSPPCLRGKGEASGALGTPSEWVNGRGLNGDAKCLSMTATTDCGSAPKKFKSSSITWP